ncbi:MAG TPA: D-alanine--D-alanine ligase family protein, partial [Treponemataceae bacterium]|nr:D-alanine--D-alanine ligase family protein [Treponemataceae bacterium]
MKIAILYGGKSSEHEISLQSASSIVLNIDTKKHHIVLIGITKQGFWYMQKSSQIEDLKKNVKELLHIEKTDANLVTILPGGGKKSGLLCNQIPLEIDIVLPVLHGTFGEDGHVQGLLEMANIPYCGCGTMASALTMDKEKTKEIWEENGISVVPYISMYKPSQKENDEFDTYADSAEEYFGYPMFVKPSCAGSSVGANKAENRKQLRSAVEEAFKWDEKLIIEKCINAREIECAVTGIISASSKKTEITAYSLGEIAPTHEFYSYDAKYNDPNGAALLIPAPLDEDTTRRIQVTAGLAYAVLG